MSATLHGYISSNLPPGGTNIVVRFFTPDTQTEVHKSAAPINQVHIHLTDDTTNVVSSANATDQATLNTLLNEIKADYNAHRVSTTFHSNADNTNAVTSADATDLATSITLANEIKADYNAHRTQANVHPYTDYYNAVTSANATDLATAETLANEIKSDYNAHLTAICGSFYVYDAPVGTLDVGIKNCGSLSNLAQDQVFTEGNTTEIDFGALRMGDLNNDDAVTAADQGVMYDWWNKGGDCYGYPGNWLIPACPSPPPAGGACYGYIIG